MSQRSLDILQISTADRLGGAERIALNLHRAYRSAGAGATLAVGRRYTDEPNVMEIRHDVAGSMWRRSMWRVHHAMQPYYGRSSIARRLARSSHQLAAPQGKRDEAEGLENFDYPGIWNLLNRLPALPDVIQLHNLHGGYFDLRALPMLSSRARLVLTLHDAWLLAGHCAHSLGCERWQTGCGACPDLSIYPAIRRDATAENWRRKRDTFSRCTLYLATPSRWLMRQVERSMLWPAVAEARVIPNGVDTDVFAPGDRVAAREALDLPRDAHVLLFAGLGATTNRFKDVATLRAAAERLVAMLASHDTQRSEPSTRPIRLIVLGERNALDPIAGATIQCVPPEHEPSRVALWYRAADVYVHAAHADTFPNTVLEAQACGTPVVATAVGGLVEQIESLTVLPGITGSPVERATGLLSPPGDADAMARGIKKLLTDDALRRRLAVNCVKQVASRYRLADQAQRYLDWFDSLAAGPGHHATRSLGAIARRHQARSPA
ncbi:D-inositol 3-phosphate glycosyltransferase [Phycisphaerae bacterium RAS2]|nr:D-inositol 3-phosphate glycosyltransferase [Phycisphaerae bacterium RAS2]